MKTAALFAALALALVGCPTDDGECTSTVTEWSCDGGICSCDEDGATCTNPEDTDASDADNCDNRCEFCDD